MLLARKGYHVLLVDRATFPSDTMRNHVILHRGTVKLHEWGLLERVEAAGTPPLRKLLVDLGDFPLSGYPPPGDGVDAEWGPRRFVLDKVLVDAAAEAGVEVREGFSVSELLSEDGRVVGIKGKTKGGSPVTERANIVIGADGQYSLVARSVEAPTYNEQPALTCGYFSYWSGVPCEGMEIYFRDRPAFLIAYRTNNGLTCVGAQVPIGEFPAFRSDVERYFLRLLEHVPALEERVRAGKREERFYGSANLEGFFRKPYGPGWALVGDAGYHKDPITAQGITDAFRDAELLAGALDDGLSGRIPIDEALAGYEQQRNEAAQPSYERTSHTASFEPVSPDFLRMRAAARGDQELTNLLLGMGVGTVRFETLMAHEGIRKLTGGG
jgi:flavin-dependent dehydrogenase